MSQSHGGPDRKVPAGTPRWVKLFGITGLAVVLLMVLVMLLSGGEHGPWRHLPSHDSSGQRP